MISFDVRDYAISISEFKTRLSEVIKEGKLKIIMKNNKPVSVVMSYEEYLILKNKAKEGEGNNNN